MIKNKEPITISEVISQIEGKEDKSELKGFLKKFSKISKEDALELKKKLIDLNLIKLKQDQIIKIIDLMPEDKEDLNKIFTDISLDEDEIKKILETVKEFK